MPGQYPACRDFEVSGLEYPRVGWKEFIGNLRIRQGEHVTIIKPTGGGKSTLIREALNAHRVPDQVILVTKTYDETFDQYVNMGWKRIEEWPPKRYMHKVLLWPKLRGLEIPEYQFLQRRVFRHSINSIARERGWTVVCDEENYLCEDLGMTGLVKWLHHQGRSSGITAWTGIQRPAWVPRITYSSATHAFIGATNDRDDLKRIAEIGNVDKRSMEHNAANLGFFDFIYLPARVPDKSPVIVNVRRG